MEDKCICCGVDVSDMSTQVCKSCFDERINIINSKLLIRGVGHYKYQEWLNQKPNRWQIISYLKWRSKNPVNKSKFF